MNTYYEGRLGKDNLAVMTFVTPSSPTGYVAGNISFVEWPGSQAQNPRTMVVSEVSPSCDLSFASGFGVASTSSTIAIFFLNDPSQIGQYNIMGLRPNTRYFVSVANKVGGENTCLSETLDCDIRIEMNHQAY
jgi:hypothetical protein